RRAGLTHGGFYAHFDSKDDLLAAIVPHAMADSAANLARLQGDVPSGLLATANAYLSPEHTAHPEMGCAVAALGPELARGAPEVRQSLAGAIRKRLDELAGFIPRRVPVGRRNRAAVGALACMVGGVILARGMKPSERAAFLAECRAFLDAS